VPFYNRPGLVESCLLRLLAQALPTTRILLVDDGSDQPFEAGALNDARVHVLRHPRNRGIGAARNTIIDWCRTHGIELVIMLDSDCQSDDDFVREHLRLHAEHPDATCIGGGIVGVGAGFWAKMDRLMSWVHSVPKGGVREVKAPYLLPGTNISFKISRLPERKEVFNDRLVTGEDALLIRQLRDDGGIVLFSPTPVIGHLDRDTFRSVVRHSYAWGGHIYLIQFGRNFSPQCLRLSYRIPFLLLFVLTSPGFALLGSLLTLLPWLEEKRSHIFCYPVLFMLWMVKALAVIRVAISPRAHLVHRQ
jgi:glycosyltransferase involved in cell wall biosynthesis